MYHKDNRRYEFQNHNRSFTVIVHSNELYKLTVPLARHTFQIFFLLSLIIVIVLVYCKFKVIILLDYSIREEETVGSPLQ